MASIGLEIEGTTLVGIGSCVDTDIIIPETVTSIGEEAFYGCSSLTNIVIPNGVSSIGSYAFSNCSNLTSIVIPDSVTQIGNNAFSRCSSLENIYYNGDKKEWLNISFSINDSTPMYYANNLYMLDENGSVDYQGNKYKLLTDVVIPNCVTKIGDFAFYYCRSLISIVIPDSVTSIGDAAFCGCGSLTKIVIPESVISIGSAAFCGCGSLTIYCEAKTMSSEWSEYWNSFERPVYWAGEWSYVNGVPTPNN